MKKLIVSVLVMMISALQLFAAAPTELNLPTIIGNDMVLQRNKDVPIWGWDVPGKKVTVSFAGQKVTAKANKNGKWKLKLKPMKANSKPASMTISGSTKIVLKNIVVGDVWVCSGQSNMSFYLASSLDGRKVTKNAKKYPLIRQAEVLANASYDGQTHFKGEWNVAGTKKTYHFTAVGYFFALRLYKELKIPIGLINASVPGTPIEAWTPREGFETIKDQKFTNDILKRITEKRSPHGHAPTCLYQTYIASVIPFAIRGVIWYQGESNAKGRKGEGLVYYHKMHALVDGWRKNWKQGDFPFYWVQLANFKTDKNIPACGQWFAMVRDGQRKALNIKNSGMAVIIDIGETKDIHPKNKKDVGDRLAQLALAKEYGREIVPNGPLYKKARIKGNKIIITFDDVGDGLMVGKKEGMAPTKQIKNGKLARFAIAGADKKWFWADAVIKGDKVIVSSPKVKKPVAVRYAYSTNPLGANLYNKEGLPASPFRTDNW